MGSKGLLQSHPNQWITDDCIGDSPTVEEDQTAMAEHKKGPYKLINVGVPRTAKLFQVLLEIPR